MATEVLAVEGKDEKSRDRDHHTMRQLPNEVVRPRQGTLS